MKLLLIGLLSLILTSCIPVKKAPLIQSYKVMVAKKFHRKLPKRFAFVFRDPKEANEFYHFIESRFESNFDNFQWNVPISVNGTMHNFTIYEVERSSTRVNLIPIFIDLALRSNEKETIFEDDYSTRSENWYFAITVSEDDFSDCLKSNDAHKLEVLEFLDFLRLSYLHGVNQF